MLCSARLFSIILFPILSHCSIISGISSLLFLLCSSLVGGHHDDADDADVDDALDDAHEHAWPSTNVGNRASGGRKFMPISGANGISPQSTLRSPASIARNGWSNRVSPRSTPRSPESTAKNGRSTPTSCFEIIILLIRRDGVEGSLLRSGPARETVRPCTALRFSGGIGGSTPPWGDRGVDSPLGVSFVCLPATAHLCKWA